ncbi:FecR family protein [Sphingobacterium corticibacterium]|uniref:DUF4974 domain-containing protein n=1 Tax=Sphingobacterium corticibacterium TaxID=2484746 RepID=A0A4V2DBF8_9SPHI|nr:FecR domain-containing protein [Sphingobacterium corticibacterium]RZF57476.1 DUF4974 domain-containing protein [Sphingobacterium corticibacterium]
MEIDPELLHRYWKKECTPSEIQQVERWLEAGEPNVEYGVGDDLDEDELQQELWSLLKSKKNISSAKSDVKKTQRKNISIRRPNPFLTSGIAAALVLLGLLLFIFQNRSNQNPELTIAQYKEITVPQGKKMTITLNDGTKVSLNSGSTLRYPESFSVNRRHVVLDGEAFFNVAHDLTRPFIAETARSNTRVLGTQFNLRDFVNETNSSIVVKEGKVLFSGTGCADTLILQADERAVFSENGIHKTKGQISGYIDWLENTLYFNDITLDEAALMIERWYDINIELDDPMLARLKIKGSFKQKSLQELMNDLAFLLNLHYRIDKKDVLLYK